MCCCSFSTCFPFIPGCHNISFLSDFLTALISTQSDDWKYYDKICSRHFPAWKLNGFRLVFQSQNRFPFVSDVLRNRTQTTRLRQPDLFHTAISINEVITERTIIKCHPQNGKEHTALTCQCYQLCDKASDLYLLHTDRHFTHFKPQYTAELTHTQTHTF